MVLTDEARSSEVNILARPKSPAQPIQAYIHLFQMKLEIKCCVKFKTKYIERNKTKADGLPRRMS